MTKRAWAIGPHHARKPSNVDSSSINAIRPGTDRSGPFAESTQPGRTSPTSSVVVRPSGEAQLRAALHRRTTSEGTRGLCCASV